MFLRPYRVIEVILAEWKRLSSNISGQRHLGLLVAVLYLSSVLYALPYGAVLGVERFWRVAVLFLGSLLICFPSLHVFTAFLGCRVNLAQNLILSLLITSVAGMFSFGFFPILWFLQTTMAEGSERVTIQHLSTLFLGLSLLAGGVHLVRCLLGSQQLRPRASYPLLFLLWQVLFAFISYRMARFLELL